MGQAIETVGFSAVNPGAAGIAVTMATGDSNRVRTFNPAAGGKLIAAVRQGATEGFLQIASPALHDNVRGIRFITSETPTVFAMPREIGQPVVFGDTLTITLSGGAAETEAGSLTFYYADLAGISARLHQWADISAYIEHIKPLEVDFNSAAAGTWADTVITTTEDLLNADRSYAVLGYSTDTACVAVGVKGQETGNLRLCGPGTTSTDDTNDYFAFLSEQFNIPAIPVISANNKGSLFVSELGTQAAAVAFKAQLWLARLATGFTG